MTKLWEPWPLFVEIHLMNEEIMEDKFVGESKGTLATVTEVEWTNEESPKLIETQKPAQESQKQPLPRRSRTPILEPTFDDLIDLALMRVLDIVVTSNTDPPPRLFPNSEHIRHTFFPTRVWNTYGDMETEFGRVSYMLARYPERCAPLRCSETIRNLLNSSEALGNWFEFVGLLRQRAEMAKEEAWEAMNPHFPEVSLQNLSKDDFWRVPTSYSTDQQTTSDLWSAALTEMALDMEAGKTQNTEAFLQVHAYIKDPIGGLKLFSPQQTMIFSELWHRARAILASSCIGTDICIKTFQYLAAQLAVESSFLAIPCMQQISHVHFSHHHQLCLCLHNN